MNIESELVKCVVLPDFPSGSGINYYNNNLYLIGDDATCILILDKDYKELDRINVFDFPGKRIPKSEKVDFETSTILRVDNEDYLCIIGSGSKKRRAVIFLMSLTGLSANELSNTDYLKFAKRLEKYGLESLNLEGAAVIGDEFVLANRGNLTNPKNYLIVTSKIFWKNQKDVFFSVVELVLPSGIEKPLGVSELCYVESHDLLFIAMSLEDTSNSYDDGAIGDSYIGWVTSIREKIRGDEILVSGIINLSSVNSEFSQQKIEGLCVEKVDGNDFILHLVSDNDIGESKLFKIRLTV